MMERESPQVSRGVFLVWNIPFNALDSGLRDFLFGPLKSAQFRLQLDFPKLRPTGRTRSGAGRTRCVLSWKISASAVETSVVGRILCGSHRIDYGPYESRSDPVFSPFFLQNHKQSIAVPHFFEIRVKSPHL